MSDSAGGWRAAGNLGASRMSIRMDDRTDGQREDDGTHGVRGRNFLPLLVVVSVREDQIAMETDGS